MLRRVMMNEKGGRVASLCARPLPRRRSMNYRKCEGWQSVNSKHVEDEKSLAAVHSFRVAGAANAGTAALPSVRSSETRRRRALIR
jgi:hypothetical protein